MADRREEAAIRAHRLRRDNFEAFIRDAAEIQALDILAHEQAAAARLRFPRFAAGGGGNVRLPRLNHQT